MSEDAIGEVPDYYLLLSWNFLDFFIEKYADYLHAGGKFILPHPVVKVIGKDGQLVIDNKVAQFSKFSL